MDFKDQLKSSVEISAVIGKYVRLQKAGAQSFKGLCPFHNEKTPSFNVHVTRQFYKCFSCGAGGDVFKFVMEIEGISFYEALKMLAEQHGVPMPKRSVVADDDSKLREAVFHMHELAQENFRANFQGPSGEPARTYIERRGVAPETIEQFGLGYSDRSGKSMLRLFEHHQFTTQQIEESGLVRKREDGTFYDYFRNRLMFPIHNESGKIIGFGGRALSSEDNPKYLNSPKTPIYEKSRVLYNLHRAKEVIRKEDRGILVEGYMDAIGVTAAGFHGVVASCGTSLTTQQVQALKRFSPRIVVNFDPDGPGANAAERSISLLLEESMHVRIMELDGDLDPDEYCKERGAKAYNDRLVNAKGYFYWLADRARKKFDLHTSEGIVATLQFLKPAVQRVSDKLERMAVANDLASYIGVERGMVLDSFRKAIADRQEKPMALPKVEIRHDERVLLNGLFGEVELAGEIIRELRSIDATESLLSRRIFQTVFAIEQAGETLSFDQVNARLEDGDRNLLAEAVLREETEVSREEVAAAIESVRRSSVRNQRAQLKNRIKESERGGRWQEALRLMQELQQLEQGEPR
ncbi:MAG TPA: DNA primase [Bryobacteraceae bacterium]|nr:DNA primase [Bryobacteraceae bacterium]